MSRILDPAAYVYEGFWINWTKGRVQGLTLTLNPTGANLLIAVLALFVTMSGSQLWTIIRFTLHQMRASKKSRSFSMLYDQQQFVLRNTTTDLATAQRICELAWSWRKSAAKPFSSSIAIVLTAAIHFVFFIIAGTLSSNLASAGQTVLSRSPYCELSNNPTYIENAAGRINASTAAAFATSVQFLAQKKQDVQLSLEYMRECYMTSTSAPLASYESSSCQTFQQPELNFTVSHNGSCPFDPNTCSETSQTIVFDTGPIDSHNDLGINANYDDRLTYRRVTNCTVLNGTSYTTGWVNQTNSVGSQLLPELEIAYAFYGPSLQYATNWTYAYSDFELLYTNFTAATTIPYQIFVAMAYGESSDPSQSDFTPRAEITQSHADLILIFLSFIGEYTSPIDDPWFSAHRVRLANAKSAIARTTYVRDEPISTLACTEQHQICTIQDKCTPLLGFDQVQVFIDSNFNLTEKESATLNRVMRAATDSSISQVVEGLALSMNSLLALNEAATETTTLSQSLPPNQWELEVTYWHSVAMAQLQRMFVEYGTGQGAELTTDVTPPTTYNSSWICDNLMIQGTTFQSFSVLILALMVGFGALIVLLSLTIEDLAHRIQRWLNRGSAEREDWEDHDMLGPRFWRNHAEQHPHSRGSSFTATRSQKSGQVGVEEKEIASKSLPDRRSFDKEAILTSYREEFVVGNRGSWI